MKKQILSLHHTNYELGEDELWKKKFNVKKKENVLNSINFTLHKIIFFCSELIFQSKETKKTCCCVFGVQHIIVCVVLSIYLNRSKTYRCSDCFWRKYKTSGLGYMQTVMAVCILYIVNTAFS